MNWNKEGVLRAVLHKLAEDLKKREKVDLAEAYIDGSHSGAGKRGLDVNRTRGGQTTKIMAMVDRNGLPIAAGIAGGAIHEAKLVASTLRKRFTRSMPKILIGDKAYDSDPLDALLRCSKVEMISPHRAKRITPMQDKRSLRRYKRS